MAGFQLFVYYSPYNCDEGRQIRIRIECAATCGLSDAIFVYRTLGSNQEFNRVASTIDMVEVPAANPNEYETFKWIRLNYIDLLVRSPAIAEDLVAEVKSDVRHLFKNMKHHNTLLSDAIHIIGDDNVAQAITYKNTEVVLETGLTSAGVISNMVQGQRGTLAVRQVTANSYSLVYSPTADYVGRDAVRYTKDAVTKDIILDIRDSQGV